MKKLCTLLLLSAVIMIGTSCSSSSTSPSTPDGTVVQYYKYIIKNDVKALDLMAFRFVGGTEREREKLNLDIEEKINKYNGNLTTLMFPFNNNGNLTKVEIIPNDNGEPYTNTTSRLLRDAEAAEVDVLLTFENGSVLQENHIAVKIDGKWKIY